MVHQCMIKSVVMWPHILVVSLLMCVARLYMLILFLRQSLMHSLVN